MTDRRTALIEKAAREIDPMAFSDESWLSTPAWQEEQQLARQRAEAAINAACPGLLTGEAWVAPWEPDMAMISMGEDRLEEFKDSDWDSNAYGDRIPYDFYRPGHVRAIFESMRDAHLNVTTASPEDQLSAPKT